MRIKTCLQIKTNENEVLSCSKSLVIRLENIVTSYKYLTRYMVYILSQLRYYAICITLLAASCTNHSDKRDKNVITDPGDMNEKVTDQLEVLLNKAIANSGKIDDSTQIELYHIVEEF